jgi:S-adenosylmethionine:tRNA ribosyltransferase-isomerase
MKTSDFDYNLPEHLIAQQPCEIRSQSRLLHYSRADEKIEHHQFSQIIDLVEPSDLLVFNNTRVIPARMYGIKETGGKVEILIERLVDETHCLAHVKASKTPKAGTHLKLKNTTGKEYQLTVEARDNDLFVLVCAVGETMAQIMEDIGHMPLPPYIARGDTKDDLSRYQTVYAKSPGAVAAPTAGLHFDDALLTAFKNKGIQSAFVTLHVGAGTFQPVRCDDIKDHHMHFEYLSVPQETVDRCQQTRENGGRIIAVGTTTVRSLETASQKGELEAYNGETDIFIYPGYGFKSIDALITNFHLPESTLLMLISAFSSREEIMHCYAAAIAEEYRFFSYGDAMFIS